MKPLRGESRDLHKAFKSFVQKVAWDAERIPESERLAPRPSKPGALDLTSARLFIEKVELHAELLGHDIYKEYKKSCANILFNAAFFLGMATHRGPWNDASLSAFSLYNAFLRV